ncbi:hypothetical protein K0M31_011448 [Melipona bicolor]|uniref:Uncharacterized protein n=1 Tax=Melipona bicolor TaxID=60889 RepID=A0AA40KUX0_9HYME|nr:hypothetical protein K0M31_011448 [Melipona bicolor]
MVNLLEKLNYSRTILIQAKDAEGREDGSSTDFQLTQGRDTSNFKYVQTRSKLKKLSQIYAD